MGSSPTSPTNKKTIDIKFLLGIIALILSVVCFAPYYRDLFKRKTQPHIYSWLVWSILQAIGVAGQLKDGAGYYGTWGLTVGAIFCLGIFVLSFRYGTKNITRFDSFCLAAAFIALLLYFLVENPLWSVIVVALTDFIGFIPTFRKGFEEPHTETASTFALSALINLLSIGALQNYTFTTVSYLVTLLLSNSAFVLMILIRRKVIAR